MNRILVTGATGFIGYEVARQLSSMGAMPRLLIRRPLRGALLASLDAELMQGDLESPESLERAVKDIDSVLHLGARATFESYVKLRPTIVDGSLSLMQAAMEAEVSQFVYASSLLVYRSQSTPIVRGTRADSRLGYSVAKLETEDKLARLAESAGIHFASIRLPHVYGSRDLIFEQVRRGRTIYPGAGRNRFTHLHIDDAARLLIRITEKAWSGIAPVGDRHAATWSEFFATIRQYYPGFRLVNVPMPMALLATTALSLFGSRRARPFLFTPDAVRGANANIEVADHSLWQELDLDPKYPTIHEGIPAVLDDCVAFRWRHPISDKQ